MIGLIAHSEKPDAQAALREMIAELTRRNIEFDLEKETAALAGFDSTLDASSLAGKAELLVVMGGDGTILRVVHQLGATLRPILGVNIGSLGFLTCASLGEIPRAVESIVRKDFILSWRNLLVAEITTLGGKTERLFGLNEVVVSRGERSQLVKIEVEIDGAELTHYNADGLIIATPTGSTAYSLAAGGPILMPDSGAFVITPICPHVLTNRSTVVSDRSVIQARLFVPKQKVFVSVDGRSSRAMQVGDILRISKSDRRLPLVMLPETSFPEVLRQKLKWSGSNV
ncbi:MAG TPA: NAD(+)/NADH kinase [Terrimicrobiaceae bacterium]